MSKDELNTLESLLDAVRSLTAQRDQAVADAKAMYATFARLHEIEKRAQALLDTWGSGNGFLATVEAAGALGEALGDKASVEAASDARAARATVEREIVEGILRVEMSNDRSNHQKTHKSNLGPYSTLNPEFCLDCMKVGPWASGEACTPAPRLLDRDCGEDDEDPCL